MGRRRNLPFDQTPAPFQIMYPVCAPAVGVSLQRTRSGSQLWVLRAAATAITTLATSRRARLALGSTTAYSGETRKLLLPLLP